MFVFFHDSILQRCMAEEVLFCFLWASAASLIYILHIHILLPTIRHFFTSCCSFHLSMADGRNYNSFGRAQRAILAYILHIFDRNAFRRAIVMAGAEMPFIFRFTHTAAMFVSFHASGSRAKQCQLFSSKTVSAWSCSITKPTSDALGGWCPVMPGTSNKDSLPVCNCVLAEALHRHSTATSRWPMGEEGSRPCRTQ